MPEEMADGGRRLVTLDDLIDALDKRERAPSNVPKVETFHFKGDRVSDWLDLTEQVLVGLSDEVKLQRVLRCILHSHHREVSKVVDAAGGSWTKFGDLMRRKYRLGDDLLTMADLEAMNKEDFSTIGAFVHEFKKKARKMHGISEEAQCAIFLGLLMGSEATKLTKYGEGSERLTWATIDKGVEEWSLDQVEQHQMRLQRRKRKERDATASGTPGVKRIVTDVLAILGYDNEAEIQKRGVLVAQGRASGAVDEEAGQEDYGGGETAPTMFRVWQEREDPGVRVEEIVDENEEVTQRLRAGTIKEEPIVVESDDEAQEVVRESASTILETMEDLLAEVGRYQERLRALCEEAREWEMRLPKVMLYGSGPESSSGPQGCPSVATIGAGPRSGMTFRPPTSHGRVPQAAQSRGQNKATASQGPSQAPGRAPPRKDPEPERRKEVVEVQEEEDEGDDEEDERLRQEEDRRAEQRAKKRGIQGGAEPSLHDGVPKRKKYAVRLEEGFDVERMVDKLLEGHNDLMNLKDILASAPRLREIAMVDTGAEMNIIRERDATMLGLEVDHSDHGVLHGANCKAIFCGTASNVMVEIGRVRARTCFFVMPDVDHPILLGRSFLCRTETLVFNRHEGTMILTLSDLACGNYEIIKCRNTEPGSGRNRLNLGSFTFEESEHARRRLREEQEEEGAGEVLSPSLNDVNKAMEVVAAHDMADPEAIKDLQRMNAVTVRDAAGLPNADALSESCAGRPIISLIDLYSGYDQFPVYPPDRLVTAMHTPRGLIHMNVAPQGWTNAVAMVQRHMIRVSPHITQPYIDDLAVKGSKEKEEDEVMPGVRRFVWKHVQDIDQVLGLLEGHNLMASGPKSKHCMREATILGFVCNEKGRRPDVKKTNKFLEWSDFSKAVMQRGGRDARPRQGPQGAAGRDERHEPPRREPTPEFDDDNIELFLDVYRDYAAQRGWSMAERIHHLRGIGRFEEPDAQICEKTLTWPDVEAGMQRLRASPRGRDGMPIRLEEGNAEEFSPVYEHYMLSQGIAREAWVQALLIWTRGAERPVAKQIRERARDWEDCHAQLRRAFGRPQHERQEPRHSWPEGIPEPGSEEIPESPPEATAMPEQEAEAEGQGAYERARVEVPLDLPSTTHVTKSPVIEEPVPAELPPTVPCTSEGMGAEASTPEGQGPRVRRTPRETREEKFARVWVRLDEIHARQAEMEAAGIEPTPPVEPKTSEQRIDELWARYKSQRDAGRQRSRETGQADEGAGELREVGDLGFSATRQAIERMDRRASPSQGAVVEVSRQAEPMEEVPLDAAEEEGGAQESLMVMSTERRGSHLHELAAAMGIGTPQEGSQRLDAPEHAPRLGELRVELGSWATGTDSGEPDSRQQQQREVMSEPTTMGGSQPSGACGDEVVVVA
ncbi:hypothetical protein CBR_g28809 [Chara braunii]|uniref:Reverse transcriptase domain-containing protein n=1 Tax=Chara braunii TaxID=69332 RepID=A0A388LA81_CHABU|nr:hypothetical protein CBR_g28809 [Chara braunii]|eukprot:GBG79093.1 hypothetical protein CBR_g28809 [Chara braunii]